MLTRQIPPKELAVLDADDALRKLESAAHGLDDAERENRRIRFGDNHLPSKPEITVLVRFFQQLISPFVLLLMAVAVVSVYSGEK